MFKKLRRQADALMMPLFASGFFFQPVPAWLVAGKPETRQFKAIYVVCDAEVGQASDVLVLVCQA